MTSHSHPVADRLGYRLRLAHARVHATYEEELACWGLTVMGYAVLRLLDATPGRSQAQLARAVGMSPQAMSEVVHALRDAGRIERRPPASGGRTLELHPTGGGRRTLQAADRRLDEIDAGFLTSAEAAALLGLLDRLTPLLSAP